jgi:hypothetical protein
MLTTACSQNREIAISGIGMEGEQGRWSAARLLCGRNTIAEVFEMMARISDQTQTTDRVWN